ncbi:MAG: P-loop NTPase, partial [Bacteroidetes bacterium]|nr:P-loop NTPase [Bacteroidota bacterium]
WGELDYLIIDLPPGTGDVQLTLVQNLPLTGAVIVSTPQKMAVADARRACAMFKIQGVDVPIMGIVENMSFFSPPDQPEKQYHIFGKGGVDQLAEEFNLPVIGRLPIQTSLMEDADSGKVLNKGNIRIFADMAGRLVQQIAIESTK